MSELLKRLKEDLKKSMKQEVEFRKNNINDGLLYESSIASKEVVRTIISMFPELNKKADKIIDEDIIKLLKKYIIIEKTRELYIQKIVTGDMVKDLSLKQLNTIIKEKIYELGDDISSTKIITASSYLPKEASKKEISEWIINNIDFSTYKNKIQTIGIIKKHFKGIDGNIVKNILLGM